MDANQVWQWVTLGILVAFVAFDKAKKWFKSSDNPGYGERIAKLEKGQEEIEGRLERIESGINGLR